MRGRAGIPEALVRIATLLAERDLVRMRAAQARARAAEARLSAIAERRAALVAGSGDPALAALLARQAEALRQSQNIALGELARCKAEVETAAARARPSAGRRDLLKDLRDREVLEMQRRKARGG